MVLFASLALAKLQMDVAATARNMRFIVCSLNLTPNVGVSGLTCAETAGSIHEAFRHIEQWQLRANWSGLVNRI